MNELSRVSSSEAPLQFFHYFIEEGFGDFVTGFYYNEEEQKTHKLYAIHEGKDIMEHVIEIGVLYGGIPDSFTLIALADLDMIYGELEELFKHQCKISFSLITTELLKLSHDAKAKTNYFTTINQLIDVFKQKMAKGKFLAKRKFLFEALDTLVADIQNLNSHQSLSTKNSVTIEDAEEENLIRDIFANKNLNPPKISRLYDVLCLPEVAFFNDEELKQKEIFKQVFTSFNPSSKPQLKVFCTNEKAAYIFRKLEPLFYNFKFSDIEKARIFIDKKGDHFKENNLAKALSKFKKEKLAIEPEIIEDIDIALSEFIN